MDNATLSGITTSGNAWGGIGITTNGVYGPLGSSNISISGLTAGETNPIDFDMVQKPGTSTLEMPVNFTAPSGFDAYTVKRPADGRFTLWQFVATLEQAQALKAAGPAGTTIVSNVPVVTAVPVVGAPLQPIGTPATLTFSTLPANPTSLTVAYSPTLPSGVGAPASGTTLLGALTVTSGMANYTFDVNVSLDVSGISGFGAATQVAYYNTTTSSYVLVEGTYDAGAGTFSFRRTTSRRSCSSTAPRPPRWTSTSRARLPCPPRARSS